MKGIEGQTVTLNTGLTGLQKDVIYWTYGPDGAETIIATLNFDRNRPEHNERLHLDAQSGSLTIKNLTMNNHGLFTIQIIKEKILTQTFNLIVDYGELLSVPDIKHIPQSHTVDKQVMCSVVCTVKNGKDVTLSWYRGEERINQTSSTDPYTNLYLSLVIKEEDDQVYSCVANNPVSSQMKNLSIEEHTIVESLMQSLH
uniref:Ig-like domain-containing protein n=1 Tax=Esox lucius TaxID=8010 RepID=A0A3P8ZA46_ESOLU